MDGLQARKRVLLVEFDFAKDGGKVGDIQLRGGGLPAGAVVDRGVLDIQTTLTSDGAATAALRIKAAEDVKAAASVAANWTSGLKDIVPVGTAATMIKTTEISNVYLTVAEADLTGGKFVLPLEYYLTTE